MGNIDTERSRLFKIVLRRNVPLYTSSVHNMLCEGVQPACRIWSEIDQFQRCGLLCGRIVISDHLITNSGFVT